MELAIQLSLCGLKIWQTMKPTAKISYPTKRKKHPGQNWPKFRL